MPGKKPDTYAHNLYNNLRTLDRARACGFWCRSCRRTSAGRRSSIACSARAAACGEDPLELERGLAFLMLSRAVTSGQGVPNPAYCRPNLAGARSRSGPLRARLDPAPGEPLRLAPVPHRCRARARPIPIGSPRRCRASICTTRSSPCRMRRSSPRCARRAPVSISRRTARCSSCAVWASPPERCIHTHPIKRDCDIRTALVFGVTHFVVDNPDELRKFVKFRNRASLLIRVAFRSAMRCVDLSRKFGCEPEAAAGPSGARGGAAHQGRRAVVPRRLAGGRTRRCTSRRSRSAAS